MKQLLVLLLALTISSAWASPTRFTETDSLISADHSKTWNLPTASDTLIGQLTTNALQGQVNGKESAIATGTLTQYWRGDKSWQTLDTSVVPENGNLYFTTGRVSAASPIQSVFGRTGTVTATSGDYNSSQITENTNLYFTNTRAQAAVSATLPIVDTAGVFSMAQVTTLVDGYLGHADYVTLMAKQTPLGFTPENVANKSTDTTLGGGSASDTLYSSQLAVKTYVDNGLAGKQATGTYLTSLLGDVTATGSGYATLAASGVTASSYLTANITVDAKGRITAASNGSASGLPALPNRQTWVGNGSNVATAENFAASNLTDMSISSPSSSQVLAWNGSAWQNQLIAQATGSAMNWLNVTGTSTNITTGYAYTASASAVSNFYLPSTCTLGSNFEIYGKGGNGWELWSNSSVAGQQLFYGSISTATSATGTALALWKNVGTYDMASFICSNTNVGWTPRFLTGGAIQSTGISMPSSVIAYYHLDESTGNYVDSKGSNTLTRIGSPGVVSGKWSNAWGGTGANGNYAVNSSDANFDFPANRIYAFDFWLKVGTTISTANTQITLMELGGGGASANIQLGVIPNGGTFEIGFDVYSQNYGFRYLLTSIAAYKGDGLFHHIVATFSRPAASNTVTLGLYIDSVSQGTTTMTQSNTPSGGFLLGTAGGGSDYTTYQSGQYMDSGWAIDDIAIWKGAAPTGTQISQRYNSGTGNLYY